MPKFLIVGFGSIGKRHFDNLRQIENVRVSILTRRHLDLPDAKVYSSIKEAIDEDFDAIFIANETALHLTTAIAFAERGYNLFIEKPLSHSLEGVDKLVSLVSKHNLKLMVGCNMRFHPSVRLLKEFIQQGKIGQVISARIEAGQYLPDWRPGRDYRDSYSARREQGGGVILDLIHELDYVYWFFGGASKIFCFSGKKGDLEIETEDVAEIIIEFENSTLCEVHLDYLQRYPGRSVSLIGTEGVIQADLIASWLKVFEAGKGDWEAFDMGTNFERNEMYQDEIKHFMNYLSGSSGEPLIGLRDGIEVLRMALAAKESSLTGRAVQIQPETRYFR